MDFTAPTPVVVPVRDHADVAALFEANYELLFRVGYLLTGSRQDAEDVVQEAFVKALPHLDRADNPVGYLRTTMVNVVRSRHRRKTPPPIAYDLDRIEFDPHLAHFADALARLPFQQRAVLVLRYYLQVSDDAIAETLGCSRNTVRSSARRGLARLRKEIPE
jgi:RNA polymerase sigma factor (sigma-70 family)